MGDHSAKTFAPLWAIVAQGQCYFYLTDGWSVYPGFIPEGDQIISKTYMTRVEGENTRLRHYLARLHRMLFQNRGNAETCDSVAPTLPRVLGCSNSSIIHAFIRQSRLILSRLYILYTDSMNQSLSPDLQRSIQQNLQEIASQMGKPLDAIAAEHLCQDAHDLLNLIPYEPLTLARVAGTLLVYHVQEAELEEVEWFKSQVQQCSDDETVEELIESMHRTDAL